MKNVANLQIRPARVEDVQVILQLIRDLATYERAPDEVTRDGENSLSMFCSAKSRWRKCFSRLKENRRSDLRFIFLIFPRGSGDPDCISKICS